MSARKRGRPSIPLIERVVGIVSLLIVLATIGYLVADVLRGNDEAALTVTVEAVRESAGSYVVDVMVRNNGRRAAADVQLAGFPGDGGNEPRASARLDYVPGLSTRRANLVFDAHPGDDPQVRIVGYSPP